MRRFLVVISVVIAAIAYSCHQPIPEGIEQAWKLRLFLGVCKWAGNFASIGETLGLGSLLNNSRTINSIFLPWFCIKGPSREIVAIDDTIEGVPVRIYFPKVKAPNMAGLVYMHGGGWVQGHPDLADDYLRLVVSAVQLIAVSIDYRLAPENPFPAPFEDCLKVTEYILNKGDELGIDTSRVAVAGDSAGGQLAAAVSLKLRHHVPPLKAQLLIYPALQSVDLNTPSYVYNKNTFNGGVLLTGPFMEYFYSNHALGNSDSIADILEGKHMDRTISKFAERYLNYSLLPNDDITKEYRKPSSEITNYKIDETLRNILLNPYYNTLLARNITNVPEAYVVTCQYDVLRDDGIFYAKKLEHAGVKVTLDNVENGFHGLFLLVGYLPEADRATERMIDFLRNSLK